MSKSRKLAYLALLSAAVAWGIAPPVIKYTLNFVTPVSFLFYRLMIASAIVFIPLILRLQKIKPSTRQLATYLGLGFLCTPLNLLLLFLGIQKTSAIDASLISITSPILIAVGGAIFLKENVTKTEKIGIMLALTGAFITILQPLFEEGTKLTQNIEGNLLVFSGTLIWVVFTLLTKKARNLDPFLLSSSSFLVGFFAFLPLTILQSQETLFYLPSQAVLGILYMGIFSSVVAYFAHIYGLTKIEASEAGVFTYLQPIFAVPLAAIFLGEKITLPFLMGAFFIAAGVFICEYRFKKFRA